MLDTILKLVKSAEQGDEAKDWNPVLSRKLTYCIYILTIIPIYFKKVNTQPLWKYKIMCIKYNTVFRES